MGNNIATSGNSSQPIVATYSDSSDDSFIYVGGHTNGWNTHFGLAKLNTDGEAIWIKRVKASSGNTGIYDLSANDSGQLIASGSKSTNNASLSFENVNTEGDETVYTDTGEAIDITDQSNYFAISLEADGTLAWGQTVPAEVRAIDIFEDNSSVLYGRLEGDTTFSNSVVSRGIQTIETAFLLLKPTLTEIMSGENQYAAQFQTGTHC